MTNLKLKVGKRYRNRQGDVTEIFQHLILTTHTFAATDGRNYRFNGRVGFFKESPLDLVEEISQEQHIQILLDQIDWSRKAA